VRKFKLGVSAALLAFSLVALGLGLGTAHAETIAWEGNGADDGLCNNIGAFGDLEPGAGQQGWLFILTNPDNVPDWTLTAIFDDPTGEVVVVEDEQQGGGNSSVHFVLYTSVGATLESASATGGSLQSNLVVSHCEIGEGGPGLVIHKVCDGGAGQFGFTLDPDGDPAGPHLVNCGGASDLIEIEPGTEYTLTENDPPAETWTFETFECNVEYQETENGVVFVAPADTLIVCTATNSFDPGDNPADPTLVIHKVCEGADGEFAFSLDPDGDPAGPYDVACNASSEPITLVAGEEYTLVETDLASDAWALLEIDCNLAFEVNETGDGVIFTASSGAEIECTATNELTTFVLQSFPGTSSQPGTPGSPSGGGGGSGGGATGGEAPPAATEAPVSEVSGVQRLPATGSGGAASSDAGLSAAVLVLAVVLTVFAGGAGLALRRYRHGP
jgi:hypothetical protein